MMGGSGRAAIAAAAPGAAPLDRSHALLPPAGGAGCGLGRALRSRPRRVIAGRCALPPLALLQGLGGSVAAAGGGACGSRRRELRQEMPATGERRCWVGGRAHPAARVVQSGWGGSARRKRVPRGAQMACVSAAARDLFCAAGTPAYQVHTHLNPHSAQSGVVGPAAPRPTITTCRRRSRAPARTTTTAGSRTAARPGRSTSTWTRRGCELRHRLRCRRSHVGSPHQTPPHPAPPPGTLPERGGAGVVPHGVPAMAPAAGGGGAGAEERRRRPRAAAARPF